MCFLRGTDVVLLVRPEPLIEASGLGQGWNMLHKTVVVNRLAKLGPVPDEALTGMQCSWRGHEGPLSATDVLAKWGYVYAGSPGLLCVSCNSLIAQLVARGAWLAIDMLSPTRGQLSGQH